MGFFDGLFGTPSTSTTGLNSLPANSRNMGPRPNVSANSKNTGQSTNVMTNSRNTGQSTNVMTNSRNTKPLPRMNVSENAKPLASTNVSMNSEQRPSRNNGPTMKALIGGARTRRVKSKKKGRKSRSNRLRR